MSTTDAQTQPHLHQHGHEVQRFDQIRDLPIGLEAADRVWFVAEHLVDVPLIDGPAD